jgi:hypothetical protein
MEWKNAKIVVENQSESIIFGVRIFIRETLLKSGW